MASSGSNSFAIASTSTAPTPHKILSFLGQIQRSVVECLPDGLQDAPPLLKTCVACRNARAKCSGGTVCSRCRAKEVPCDYAPQKRMGRPVKSAKTVKLQSVQRDLDRLYLMLQHNLVGPSSAPLASTSAALLASAPGMSSDLESDESTVESEESPALWQDLTNPLRLLALATEASSDAAQAPNDHAPPPQPVAPSIFDYVFEDEPQLDPVTLGYVSEADWYRLVDFYYDQLHPFCPFLDPFLHRSTALRKLSPFLATIIALAAAAFSPTSNEVYVRLEQHALYLSGKIFLEGYKSLEIISAYAIWIRWSPLTPIPTKERFRTHLGEASRIAADIRVHLPLQNAVMEQYKTRCPAGAAISADRLNEFRQRVQQGLFCFEMQQMMQIGRLQHLPLVGSFGFPPSPTTRWDPAGLALMQTVAAALHKFYGLANDATLDAKARRSQFISSWQRSRLEWQRSMGGDATFSVRLGALSYHIVILSFSLRFGGPVVPILTECRDAAEEAVKLAVEHAAAAQVAVPCSPNVDILNIAAAVNFLIRFSVLSGQARTPCLTHETKQLCSRAVEVLQVHDRRRLNGPSIASYFARRLKTILSFVTIIDLPPIQGTATALPPLLTPLQNLAPPINESQQLAAAPTAVQPLETAEWLAQSEAFWAQMGLPGFGMEGSLMDPGFSADWPML
ncbi:hypothetical protein JCM6882_007992 [Rhodosporidiobolus microsporus]